MRVWLSEKASQQLKGDKPPSDFLECEEHGKQAYVRAPAHLVEDMGKWCCGECARQTTAKQKEEKEAKKREQVLGSMEQLFLALVVDLPWLPTNMVGW